MTLNTADGTFELNVFRLNENKNLMLDEDGKLLFGRDILEIEMLHII